MIAHKTSAKIWKNQYLPMFILIDCWPYYSKYSKIRATRGDKYE